jgi:hypothetical protein
MTRPETIYQRQMEQSLLVPIVMLALLHARQLEDGSPYVGAAEALTDWAAVAADLNLWWSTAEQREAKAEAEHLLALFAHGGSDIVRDTPMVIHYPEGSPVRGEIVPRAFETVSAPAPSVSAIPPAGSVRANAASPPAGDKRASSPPPGDAA